jgi:tetratricopeptide (TPR) repeat protein
MLEFAKRNVIVSVYSILILSTLLVFWQVRNFDFTNYDDNLYVSENQHVLNGLTQDSIIWAFTTTPHIGNWLPLTWLSFMLDCQLFGPNPGWMHFLNLLMHIANTLLLFAVLKKMTGSLWPSAFVAAVFALHPMHVESVAWITERKDVLSTLFFMLTLAAYVSYVRGHSRFYYLLTVLLFALSFLAKPMLVTLPFLLLLLDYWPLERFAVPQAVKTAAIPDRRRILYRIIIEKIPFFALAAVSSAITFIVQKGSGSVPDINTISLQSRIANAFLSYTRYIGKMFWPQDLAVFYPRDIGRFSSWQIILCVLLLLVIFFLAFWFGRKRKYLPVGWFWFVGTLIPVIGLIQSGDQAYADRYTYISYIGLFIMIAWGLPELLSKWRYRKHTIGISMVIVLTALGICAYRQVSYWKNSFTLFTHALEATQNNYVAHTGLGLGNDLREHGNLALAIEHYTKAIEIKPDYADVYGNLGIAYGRLGRYQEAIEASKQAIKLKPDYAEAYCNLGNVYGNLGRYEESIESFKQAIKIKPDLAEAHYNLGNAYLKLDRHQEAIESYKQAIKIKPDLVEAHCNLGTIYLNLGRYQDAVEAYKQAIKIKPDLAEAYYNLGNAYLNLGLLQDTIEAFRQAIRINPNFAEAYNNLGIVFDNLGRLQEAIETFRQAIRIKPDFADAHCNLGNAYLSSGDKESALEEYKILKTLDAEQAKKLFNLIYK